MPPLVSAYIPCYNNQETIERAIRSIQAQTVPVDELFVIDDGSTDKTVALIEAMGVTLLRNEKNLGRGATRARAIEHAKHEFIFGSDATLEMPKDFLEKAIPHFEKPQTAAVFGGIREACMETATQRWTARHLYKQHLPQSINPKAFMNTCGLLLRKSYTLEAGNFNPQLKHNEDGELGQKFLDKGYDVVRDPNIYIKSYVKDTVFQLLRRYYRWNLGADPHMSLKDYFHKITYCYGALLPQDIAEGDLGAAGITLLCPHYLFWKQLFN
tara:strand:- start:116073 stop:116879 length:807 start_codon:yes stop_codon:yes gene_type:complete